jgi:hypothetical protein
MVTQRGCTRLSRQGKQTIKKNSKTAAPRAAAVFLAENISKYPRKTGKNEKIMDI